MKPVMLMMKKSPRVDRIFTRREAKHGQKLLQGFVGSNSARLPQRVADLYKIFVLPRHTSLGAEQKSEDPIIQKSEYFVGASRATALSKMDKLSLLFQLFPTYYHQQPF